MLLGDRRNVACLYEHLHRDLLFTFGGIGDLEKRLVSADRSSVFDSRGRR